MERMKRYVRTIENGERRPLEVVEEKRKAIRDAWLKGSLQVVEYEAMMYTYDAMGEIVRERVYVLESTSAVNYA
jgi:hypothetical protein